MTRRRQGKAKARQEQARKKTARTKQDLARTRCGQRKLVRLAITSMRVERWSLVARPTVLETIWAQQEQEQEQEQEQNNNKIKNNKNIRSKGKTRCLAIACACFSTGAPTFTPRTLLYCLTKTARVVTVSFWPATQRGLIIGAGLPPKQLELITRITAKPA